MDNQKFLKLFYLSGTLIFLGIGIANIFTNISFWNSMILSAKISAILNNLFNFVISIFFFSLLKGTKKIPVEELSEDQIEEAIKKHGR